MSENDDDRSSDCCAINNLPNELLYHILNELVPPGLTGLVAQVCHRWRECIPPHKRNLCGARAILTFTASRTDKEEEAQCEANNVPLWKWATERGLLTSSKKLCVAAAAIGRLDVLQALNKRPFFCRYHIRLFTPMVKEAASGGHLHVLQWIHQRSESWQRSGFKFDACYAAALAGHTHVLQWMTCAPGLQLQLADVLRSYNAGGAALGGHLETLKWMKDEIEARNRALEKGEGGGTIGKRGIGKDKLEFDVRRVCQSAAAGGHFHVLRWAVEVLGYNPSAKKERDGKLLYARAAGGGHLDVLQWLEDDLGLPFDGDVNACCEAAYAGHLDALQWLLARGGQLGTLIKYSAARGGQLHVLQWLVDNGCSKLDSVVDEVAAGGHIHVLRWLLQHRGAEALVQADSQYNFSRSACTKAAENGHLEVLQFLRLEVQPPFSWSEQTSQAALKARHWKMLRWMCWEAHCPASQRTLRKLRKHERESIYRKRPGQW
ncbi:Ankyrin repeat domain containing protein [Balamuthia mandrillaris]